MSKQWTNSHGVPLVNGTEPKIVKNFNEAKVEYVVSLYTFPITLRYEFYYIKESFKIDPMEDSYDIMFPYWWIFTHGTLSGGIEENDILQFMSKHCHQHCTKAALSWFSNKYDHSIVKFSTDP
jgi:hypothetical protein